MLQNPSSESNSRSAAQEIAFYRTRIFIPVFKTACSVSQCSIRNISNGEELLCRGADKYLAFHVSPTGGLRTTKKYFFGRLKKLEKRNHKYVEHRGEYY
jgi:hypothetical protein